MWRRASPDPRFVEAGFEPACLSLRGGAFWDRVTGARRAGRLPGLPTGLRRSIASADETGVCHTGRQAVVSSAFAHRGEEDCLRGTRGSGTIFFSYCNLRCVFCQNHDISQGRSGHAARAREAIADSDARAAGPGLPQRQPRDAGARRAAGGRGAGCWPWSAGCGCRSSTTPPRTTRSSSLRAPRRRWSTSTCPTSSSGSRRRPTAISRPATTRRWRAPRSARCTGRSGDLRFTPDGLACRGVLVRHLVMPGPGRGVRSASSAGSPTRRLAGHLRERDGAVPPRPPRRRAVRGDRSPALRAGDRDGRRRGWAAGLWRFDER